MLNLATVLEDNVRRFEDKTAVKFMNMSLSYRQLNAGANQIANGLRQSGIGKGDKVALSCPNSPYFPMVYFGILKTGAAVVPLNILFKKDEIAYHLKDSEAKAYFCFEGTDELPMGKAGHEGFQQADDCKHFFFLTADPKADSPVENIPTLGQLMHNQSPEFETVNTSQDDTAVILYTSGTTGQPKGAELSHFNLVMNARGAIDLLQFQRDDIQLVVLPLFHAFGQVVQMLAGFCSGNTLVMLPRFEPKTALHAMQEEQITVFAGVPTMYWALLNYPEAENYDLKAIAKKLRLCVSGGASMPVEVMKSFEKRFSVPILEGYGLSESSPIASFNHLDRERKVGSVGIPIWGVEMRIVDENDQPVPQGEKGEIVIRGHNIMKGYYKREEINREVLRNGWFHTGDVGTMDEDGFFYIVDRTKDMIIRGGFNVYPREIEEVMMQHPAISYAAVLGVPDDRNGEEIKAFVVLKAGEKLQTEGLIDWCKEKLASYKYPRHIEFRESLPMTATGKILKKELRKEMNNTVEE